MMVDMATPYDQLPGEDSQFAQMRDSLYILSVMNQCKSKLVAMIVSCTDWTFCRSHQAGLGQAG